MGTSTAHLLLTYDARECVSVYDEMLRSTGEAVAISRVLDPDNWFIYSGSPDMLRSFVSHIRTPSRRPTRQDVVAAATTSFHGLVRLTLQASDFSATSAIKSRPAVGTYPNNINPQGRAIWDKLMQTQRVIDNIAGQTDRAAWAIAVQLYFNKAAKSNITPFEEDTRLSHLPQHQDDHALKQRSIQQGYLIRSFVSQLHKNLKANNLVTTAQTDWVLRDVIYANNKYNVAMRKAVPMNRAVINVGDAVKRYLIAREGFSDYPRMPSTVAYRLSDTGYMLVTISQSPLRLEFNTILSFGRGFLEGAFGLKTNSLNKEALLQKLKEYSQEHLLSDANYSV